MREETIMKYDFDQVIDRHHSDSYKWNYDSDILPMWTADMDFKVATEITDALVLKAGFGLYGYSIVPDSWYEAYIGFWKRHYHFTIVKDWLLFSSGVVPTISSVVRKLTTPAEKVLLLTPVYNIFYNSILNNGRVPLEEELVFNGSSYSIVKYMPIFVNGDMSNPISEQVFYELAQYGDSSGIPLSRKIVDTTKTTRMLDKETMAEMLNDKEVSDIIKRVFAYAKFGKPKTKTVPAKPEDGFDTKIAQEGRNKGYELGQQDFKKYVDYDDNQVQTEFEKALFDYIKEYCPSEYVDVKATWYANGFKKGYESGVNAPIKKEQCGYDDGVKFVDEVKKKFGEGIKYTSNTRVMIDNFVKGYLNDTKNIPVKYRGMLYRRWYCDSFKRAVKANLIPVVDPKNGETIEDADNVLKHLLARLFEFLYISVYRETTFMEIFKNADPNVFLEAVGITKKDFEILNKYKIFQEDVLNNYIHDFFVNESLGSKLDLKDEEVRQQYRNSFDWFGFGLENGNAVQEDHTIANNNTNHKESMPIEEEIIPEEVSAEQEGAENAKDVQPEYSLIKKIKELLSSKQMKSSKIASELGISKKEINKILYSHTDVFAKDIFFSWRVKK